MMVWVVSGAGFVAVLVSLSLFGRGKLHSWNKMIGLTERERANAVKLVRDPSFQVSDPKTLSAALRFAQVMIVYGRLRQWSGLSLWVGLAAIFSFLYLVHPIWVLIMVIQILIVLFGLLLFAMTTSDQRAARRWEAAHVAETLPIINADTLASQPRRFGSQDQA
jgi:Flp pilus assembly protein TadB